MKKHLFSSLLLLTLFSCVTDNTVYSKRTSAEFIDEERQYHDFLYRHIQKDNQFGQETLKEIFTKNCSSTTDFFLEPNCENIIREDVYKAAVFHPIVHETMSKDNNKNISVVLELRFNGYEDCVEFNKDRLLGVISFERNSLSYGIQCLDEE